MSAEEGMELQLKVHGMVCESCSSRVQEVLQVRACARCLVT